MGATRGALQTTSMNSGVGVGSGGVEGMDDVSVGDGDGDGAGEKKKKVSEGGEGRGGTHGQRGWTFAERRGTVAGYIKGCRGIAI